MNAPVPRNLSTHLVSIQNCTKILYVNRINYIYENNHPLPRKQSLLEEDSVRIVGTSPSISSHVSAIVQNIVIPK